MLYTTSENDGELCANEHDKFRGLNGKTYEKKKKKKKEWERKCFVEIKVCILTWCIYYLLSKRWGCFDVSLSLSLSILSWKYNDLAGVAWLL